jgi:hypothetical protein
MTKHYQEIPIAGSKVGAKREGGGRGLPLVAELAGLQGSFLIKKRIPMMAKV